MEPISAGLMSGLNLLQAMVGGGIAAQRLGQRIEREAQEMQWKSDVSEQNLRFSETQYARTGEYMQDKFAAQLNKISQDYFMQSAQAYETGALPYFRQTQETLRLQSAEGRGLARQEFILGAAQQQNQLYRERVQNEIAQYENRIAQNRLQNKGTLMAQEFFTQSAQAGVQAVSLAAQGLGSYFGVEKANRGGGLKPIQGTGKITETGGSA